MKSPGNSPITAADGWFVGDDQALRWTIFDTSGVAVNITGWTLQFKLGAAQTGAALLTKAATLTTPASGICTVSILAADTSALSPVIGFYTLTRTDAGNVQVVAYGSAALQGRPS